MKFDINNPDDRAACIAGQAGFIRGPWKNLMRKKRVALGRAVQEQFPELEYKELWKHLIYLSLEERKEIRQNALQKVGAANAV